MGIPKFFRFISERWPLISQVVDSEHIPEFDNLYLDMNSILHTCTHANDGELSRMTDDQMYAAIFRYIEHLFEIIKPRQVFYMAIDGVAPRAKMNQQRARRFRTAYENEQLLKKAIESGEPVPKEDPFDSNCITPGTEFMAKLSDNLKYFIHKKISEDSNWSSIEVILSGHEVPGEGEHKIMEYIRTMRSQPGYDPNVRHCIYGLDADLIMLGLVSHDPHFALLREEVTFGPQRTKARTLNDQKFYLLHLSLVREYLELEFATLENELTFEYSFERILDDFILIMYVIGNDFLPHLPDLHINKGAFPVLIATFKQLLQSADGYINESGTINLRRLGLWLQYLSEFELENFEKSDVDVEWFNQQLQTISLQGERDRQRIGKIILLKDQKKLVGYVKPWLTAQAAKPVSQLHAEADAGETPELSLAGIDVTANLDFVKELCLKTNTLVVHSQSTDTWTMRYDVDGINPHETEEEHQQRLQDVRSTIKQYQSAIIVETEEVMQQKKDLYNEKFVRWKDKYYKDKLGFSINDTDKMTELTEHYVEGLQWVLYYYYRGCPSWNWYYRYHYAPRISDIHLGLDALIASGKPITFDKSHPFKPFEQLMAVLPARSKALMPVVYRPLMTEETSPIKSFYPDEVAVDMNGKTASWEAVVLLDFVDENKLLSYLKPVEQKLSPEETKRNSFGQPILFCHNPQIDNVHPSPLPGHFADLEHDQCYEKVFELPPVSGEATLGPVEGAFKGTQLKAGFPTLETVPFASKLAQNETKVFNFPSKQESMVLEVDNVWEDMSTSQFAQAFVGKLVYSRWPFLREGRVVEVVTADKTWLRAQGNVHSRDNSPDETKQFKRDVSDLKGEFANRYAVYFKQPFDTLVKIQPVTGLIRTPKGAYVKTFAKESEAFPLQLVVKEVVNKDERYKSRPPVPIETEFPVNSQVVFMGDYGYGAPTTILGYNQEHTTLSVRIAKIPHGNEPNIGKVRANKEHREFVYHPSFEVAKHLGLHPLLLSRIASVFMVIDDLTNATKVNIGLDMKYESKRQKVLGYTQKKESSKVWEYSPLAIDLITRYRAQYPKMFTRLTKIISDRSEIRASMLFDNADEVRDVKKWLGAERAKFQVVSLESQSLTSFSFEAIERYMEHYVAMPQPENSRDVRGVPREAVLDASSSFQLLSSQRFALGDRVIYVQDSGKVPNLSKGTVASIITQGAKTSLEVIFDVPLLNGGTYGGKLKTKRGMTVDSSLVLNLSNPQFVYHTKASKAKAQKKSTKGPNSHPVHHQANHQGGHPAKPNHNQAKGPAAAKPSNKKAQPPAQGKPQAKPKAASPPPNPAENAQQSHELLSILKGKSKDEPKEEAKDSNANVAAMKQIYGQIYTNVMSEGGQPPFIPPQGVPPQGVPLPGVPPQVVPPQGVPMYYPMGYPAGFPGGPVPPAFYPPVPGQPQPGFQPPQGQGQPQNQAPGQAPGHSSQSRGRGGRGRGGFRGRGNGRGGRGGRGGSRSNSATPRGSPAPSGPAATA
ncbi:5'-3' exoribonuclease 1 [Diutina rugosa]